MQQQLGIKAIPLSRLSNIKSPQEFKCQDSNREGGRVITTEDGSQEFPGVENFSQIRIWQGGDAINFPKLEIHNSTWKWKMQPANVCYKYHPHFSLSLSLSLSHTHTRTHYSYTHWSALLSFIPRSLKERELAIDYRFVTQRTTYTCLFFFLV